jgi:hypothetical protein
MGRYKSLRMWAQFLIFFGFISLFVAGFGVISWAIEVDGVWATLGVIFLGAPVVLFLASWPIALGELMRAVAGIGEAIDGASFGRDMTIS